MNLKKDEAYSSQSAWLSQNHYMNWLNLINPIDMIVPLTPPPCDASNYTKSCAIWPFLSSSRKHSSRLRSKIPAIQNCSGVNSTASSCPFFIISFSFPQSTQSNFEFGSDTHYSVPVLTYSSSLKVQNFKEIYFICMSVLLACMYIQHMHAMREEAGGGKGHLSPWTWS